MKKKIALTTLSILSLFLVGCSNKKKDGEDTAEKQTTVESVTVKNEGKELTLAANKPTETGKIEVEVLPKEAKQTVVYTSSDEKVATVSADGVITPLWHGTCTITATSTEDSSKHDALQLTVTDSRDVIKRWKAELVKDIKYVACLGTKEVQPGANYDGTDLELNGDLYRFTQAFSKGKNHNYIEKGPLMTGIDDYYEKVQKADYFSKEEENKDTHEKVNTVHESQVNEKNEVVTYDYGVEFDSKFENPFIALLDPANEEIFEKDNDDSNSFTVVQDADDATFKQYNDMAGLFTQGNSNNFEIVFNTCKFTEVENKYLDVKFTAARETTDYGSDDYYLNVRIYRNNGEAFKDPTPYEETSDTKRLAKALSTMSSATSYSIGDLDFISNKQATYGYDQDGYYDITNKTGIRRKEVEENGAKVSKFYKVDYDEAYRQHWTLTRTDKTTGTEVDASIKYDDPTYGWQYKPDFSSFAAEVFDYNVDDDNGLKYFSTKEDLDNVYVGNILIKMLPDNSYKAIFSQLRSMQQQGQIDDLNFAINLYLDDKTGNLKESEILFASQTASYTYYHALVYGNVNNCDLSMTEEVPYSLRSTFISTADPTSSDSFVKEAIEVTLSVTDESDPNPYENTVVIKLGDQTLTVSNVVVTDGVVMFDTTSSDGTVSHLSIYVDETDGNTYLQHGDVKIELTEKGLAEKIKDLTAKIDAIDSTKYSNTAPSDGDSDKTKVEKLKAEAKTAISAAKRISKAEGIYESFLTDLSKILTIKQTTALTDIEEIIVKQS